MTPILDALHRQIDELSERRRDLYRSLSEAYDPSLAAELKQIDGRLEKLWDEHRKVRAQLRWGDREQIVARARAEERLERHARAA
jgi:hypothetical protein